MSTQASTKTSCNICDWCLSNIFDNSSYFDRRKHDDKDNCDRREALKSGRTSYCFCNDESARAERALERYFQDIISGAKQGCLSCEVIRRICIEKDSFFSENPPHPEARGVYNQQLEGDFPSQFITEAPFEKNYVYSQNPLRWHSKDDVDTLHDAVRGLRGIAVKFLVSYRRASLHCFPNVSGSVKGEWAFEGCIRWYSLSRDEHKPQSETISKVERMAHGDPQTWNEWISLAKEGFALRSMLERCISHHDQCGAPIPSSRPARLLQISGHHSSPVVSLCETITQPVQYVCLSYCWGGDQAGKLTRDRLQDYLSAIPFSTLPKTIADATRLVRSMGFGYLWVDAYCILQDCDDDKGVEIAKMSSIYVGGVCTISVDSATTASEGFLERTIRNTRLDMSGSTPPLSIILEDETVADKLQPLRTRGWTLQETVLSPRLIVISKHRVSMLRYTKNIQRADGGVSTTASNYLGYPSIADSVGVVVYYPTEKWHELVTEYLERHRTDKKDKLIALSGIASEFQRRQATSGRDIGDYVAGIWSKSLIRDLLWMSNPVWRRPQLLETRPASSYVAPSWSWASRDHPIEYRDDDFMVDHGEASIVSTQVVLDDEQNPIGAVTSARITIRCGAEEKPASKFRGRNDIIDDMPWTHDETGTVWFLDIANEEPYNNAHFVGLIVQEVGKDERDGRSLYKRIGMFKNGGLAYRKYYKPFRNFTII